jgi:pentatricopeptide repeat protein
LVDQINVSVSGTKDIRVANVLIEVYAKLCMLEKAEELKERSTRGGAKPNAKTWEIFKDVDGAEEFIGALGSDV